MFSKIRSSNRIINRVALVALAALPLAACSSSAAEEGDTNEGAVEGVESQSIAVPGLPDLKTCGAGDTLPTKFAPAKVNELIRKHEKFSRVLDQQSGLSLVSLTGGVRDTKRVATWKPSPTVFGEWAPAPALFETITYTTYRPCHTCPRGESQPVATRANITLDDVEVLATWDARNEKFVGLNFVTVGEYEKAQAIQGITISPERRVVPPSNSTGVFTLNCDVDAAGKISCPETIWTPGGKSFHRLKFAGKLTTKCLLMTSKNLDASGNAPAEGTIGVTIGTKLDLGL